MPHGAGATWGGPHGVGHMGRVPHRGATSEKSWLMKNMSQLDVQVCINPVTIALPGKSLPWCGAGDTAGASARGGQEEARVEALHGGLNCGVAQSEMPPKKKQRRDPVRRSRRLSGTSEAVGVQPETTVSQQAAADGVYHDFLQSLSEEELDFVRNDGPWPAIRTSANKTGKPSVAPHKKGDWSSQRPQGLELSSGRQTHSDLAACG